jgi:hypothetical protein
VIVWLVQILIHGLPVEIRVQFIILPLILTIFPFLLHLLQDRMEIFLNALRKEVQVNVKPVVKNRWDLPVGIIGTAELHAMSGLKTPHNLFSLIS